jgi:hypothetical protein
MGTGSSQDLVVMWDDSPASGLTLLQHGLQRALEARGVPVVHRARTAPQRMLARAVARCGLIRPLVPRQQRRSLTVLSWASEARTFPDSYWREPVPWIFDCWGPQFADWERLLTRHRIRTAFFSARQAARHFKKRVAGLQAHWIPEACDPQLYLWRKPLADRRCQVLELGRKWAWLHERIRDPLARAGVPHRYSDLSGGKALFPDLAALLAGLGDTAIMLCFPRSVTHPEAAGGVETMTQRYLEGMASGCLIVGQSPRELIDLFGFDPVVPLQPDNPAQHLLEIIGRLSSYQALVCRARARLLELGTFAQRADSILSLLGWQAGSRLA